MKLGIKKKDKVMILSGRDKGKTGDVVAVFSESRSVLVEKVNIVKKHQRQLRNVQAGIIEKLLPVPISRVMLVCPECGKPTRVARTQLQGSTRRIRTCKQCGEIIDKVN